MDSKLIRDAKSQVNYTGTRVAKALMLSGKSVSRSVGKGKNIIDSDQGLLDYYKIKSQGNNVPWFSLFS